MFMDRYMDSTKPELKSHSGRKHMKNIVIIIVQAISFAILIPPEGLHPVYAAQKECGVVQDST